MAPGRLYLLTSMASDSRLTTFLARSPAFFTTMYTALAAFSLYTCVYAFRKTFPAATFEGIEYAGVSYKVWLVIFQAVGYGLSKFIGIKIISELKANRRKAGILLMVTIAGASWLLFAVIPAPYNIVFLFFNGLPLGMVWGMVFSYLEGRRTTEVLGAALSVSFIFSAGLCRSVGAYLLQDWGIPERWMPFVACCVFVVPLLLFLLLLDHVPPPTERDIRERTKRLPMTSEGRKLFLNHFLPGITLFVLVYVLLTAFRDFRDNFSAEVWKILGYGKSPEIFTQTEVPVSIAVLVVMGSVMLIRNNYKALILNHIIIGSGMVITGLSTYLFHFGYINGPLWMILIGLGLYLGYVPFNSIFFDRLIATFRFNGNVGFIMYVADSFGYLGSVSILFYKEFSFAELSWLDVYIRSGYILSVTGFILILCSMVYFHLKYKHYKSQSISSKEIAFP
jgi:MFS family permease